MKVEELRRDLRIKSQELEAKNAAANDKLKKMVKDQQEAEKKKVYYMCFFAYLDLAFWPVFTEVISWTPLH